MFFAHTLYFLKTKLYFSLPYVLKNINFIKPDWTWTFYARRVRLFLKIQEMKWQHKNTTPLKQFQRPTPLQQFQRPTPLEQFQRPIGESWKLRQNLDISISNIYDRALFWNGICTSLKKWQGDTSLFNIWLKCCPPHLMKWSTLL